MIVNKNIINKSFIVTGAAGGIGREIVRQLIANDGFVLATDNNETALAQLQKEIQAPNKFVILKHDVRKSADWQQALARVREFPGIFYGLINSVGVLKPCYIAQSTEDELNFHIDINVKGVMLGCQVVAPELLKNGAGHIINLSSLAGVAPIPGIALYSASKFAIRGFTLALASELRDNGVFVTCVSPDAVATNMLKLQLDYKEAALTFSGSKPISAAEVAETIIKTIGHENTEIMLPPLRGAMAMASNVFPDLSRFLLEPLSKRGLENQNELKKSGKL